MIDYLNGWGEGLQRHRHLVLSYEQMSADPLAASRQALGFLGIPVNEHALERAVAAASFDRMRSLELRDGLPAHEYDRNDPQSLRMRKGKVGGHTETLSEENIAAIRAACAQRLSPGARRLFV
jgi:alcohol sulfotransferase